jgi:tRNA1(Val) A37 N6-methylase TrmN6
MRGRLGALKVQPVTPRAGEAAHRVLVQGRRDARTPLVLLPPIILQNATGGPSAEAEAVLRHGAALAFA